MLASGLIASGLLSVADLALPLHMAGRSMESEHDIYALTESTDVHAQHAGPGALGFGSRSNLRVGDSQGQGIRCPPAASSSALVAGDLQSERLRPLAPENQHPNHVSKSYSTDPHFRTGDNSINAMQNLQTALMQQQQQQQHFQQHQHHSGMRQSQDFNLARQRQQMPIGSPPHDSSPPQMSPDWNLPAPTQQQQQHMMQQQQQQQQPQQFPPHFIQTPPHNAMQPQAQISNTEGQFQIPATYQSSTPSSSTSSHATYQSSSPYHTHNAFKQDYDDAIELMQVFLPSLLLLGSAKVCCLPSPGGGSARLIMGCMLGMATRPMLSSTPALPHCPAPRFCPAASCSVSVK